MSQKSLSKAQDLQRAFNSFEQISEQLSGIYQNLEDQVDVLNHQLHASREDRERQLLEKVRLAQRLSSLLDALPGGVVVLDGKGVVQECNPAARELLGEPLQGELWRDVVERSFAPRWDDGHDISLRNGASVNISTQSLDHEPGQILLLKDVTETRRLQEQLGSLKRLSAKGEMAAALAHQIRTPLSSALLYASNLAHSKNQPPENQQKQADKLMARLRHLEKLVEEMLLFARGGQCVEAQPVSIVELLQDLQRQIQPALAGSTLSLRYAQQLNGLSVNANRDALLSAMMNLLNNAIQACDNRGEICVEVLLRPAGVVISFTDNGPGIPAAIRNEIFEPFMTTRSSGTGLGLAVVQSVVAAHNGNVQLDSEYEKGARFLLSLPLCNSTVSLTQAAVTSVTGEQA